MMQTEVHVSTVAKCRNELNVMRQSDNQATVL